MTACNQRKPWSSGVTGYMAVSRCTIKKIKDESGTYLKIEGMNPKGKKPNCCPFCDASTSSGSWTPETCTKCGAVYFFNAWTKDI